MDKIQNYTNSYKYQSTVGFKADNNAAQTPAVQIPDLYYQSDDEFQPKSFKESVKKADPMGMLSGYIENPILSFGTWIALGLGMDKFANACGGEYEKSLLAKVANFGDKLENSKFNQSNFMQKTHKFFNSGKEKIKKLFGKSDLLTSANRMSVMPENGAGKGLLYTAKDEIVIEFANHIASKSGLGLEDLNSAINLKNLDLTKEEFSFIEKTFGKKYSQLTKEEAAKVANQITLKRFGLAENEITGLANSANATKTKILELMSKNCSQKLTPELIAEMSKNPKQYHKLVEEIAKESKGKVWCCAGNYEWMGPIRKFFKRRISLEGTYNKMHSLGEGAKTGTGRFMSKAVQTMYRGLTFGGGKLGLLLFIAPGFVRMFKNTAEADRDKKVGTFAWGFINAMTWPITFLLGGKLMYGIASMRHAGMTDAEVAHVNKIVENFNIKNEAKEFGSFKEYWNAKRAAKKEIKNFTNNCPGVKKGQNLLTKLGSKLSKILSFDLNKFNGYRTNSSFTTKLHKIPVGLRGKLGILIKFPIFMFAIQPLLDGILHKGSNILFGKDYDISEKEEHAEKKKEQEKYSKEDLKKRMLEIQAKKQGVNIDGTPIQSSQQIDQQQLANIQATQSAQAFNSHSSNENNIVQQQAPNKVQQAMLQQNTDEVQNQQNTILDNYSHIPSAKNNIKEPVKKETQQHRYIPSQDSVFHDEMEKKEEQKGRYIPSQMAAKINTTYDNSGLNAAINRADRAEQQALDILAGKFDNI